LAGGRSTSALRTWSAASGLVGTSTLSMVICVS
jgi:hypothetical protein